VLAPSAVQAAGLQRWVVVDGQQRLTTLMLAMCAIRDHLVTSDPHQQDRFNELYLTNKWQQGDAYLRLMPTKADRQSFFACIKSASDAGGPDNIGAAYRFFRQRLAAADDPDDSFDVDLIERVISDRLALVEITADHADNVHRIFESLNNTGLNLSEADLVRNLVFMLLPTQADVIYETLWLPMQARLTPDQLEELLYIYLVLTGRERVRRDAIYQGMQRVLEPRKGDEHGVEAVVSDLARRSLHLQRIVAPQHEPNLRLRSAFQRLNTWGALVAYPVLMLLLDKQERGEVSTDEVITGVGYIESFLVRRTVCAVPTNNLNRIFNALVNQLPADVSISEGMRQVLSRERSFWPDDEELRRAIAARPFYWQGRAPQRQLILRRLEESYPSAERVDFDAAQLTIEHVLPQALTAEWLEFLAQDAAPDETAEEVHRRLVHTLGNLTLTGYNVQLSNNPFMRKQDLLKHSNLEMNKRIAATQRWGQTEILQRAAELAERAIAIWPGPLPGVHAATGRDWSLLHGAMAALPAGSWTTYSDLAALIGSHPVPVGQHLGTVQVLNAHRALRYDGRVSPGFHWVDPTDTRDVTQILREEGVRFSEDGAADPAQRWTARELAELVGLEANGMYEVTSWDEDPTTIDAGHGRFISQVSERQGPEASGCTQRLVDDWRALGGLLRFGKSAETSCFLLYSLENAKPWPCAIYPSGWVEMAFQPMSQRAPFDDITVRDEFRQRLNQAPGVDIPEAKLSLYPSFPLRALTNAETYDRVVDALRWFVAMLAS
jgi:alkylated DNA nucleotide flippase Atl1